MSTSIQPTTQKALMRAAVAESYGSAGEVMEIKEIEKPIPGDKEVVIRVRAAGVDPSVWHLMTGTPYLVRIMGFGLRRPKHTIVGSDLAGVVEAIGAKVSNLEPGDAVFGIGRGSFAEYACAKANKVAPMPSNLSFEQAAAVAMSGTTALQGLRDVGKIEAGQKVLIIGAGGGVGTFAGQIASAMGAEVTGVCSTAKTDLVRSIGADHVIDYKHEDFVDGDIRYDLILDTAGGRPLAHLRRALTGRGTLVLVGGEGGGRWTGGVDRAFRALVLSPFVAHNLKPMFASERREDLLVLKDLIEAGKVAPVIDRTYPLTETKMAIDYVEQAQAKGKVVITI